MPTQVTKTARELDRRATPAKRRQLRGLLSTARPRSKGGRGGDVILAHLNPAEAALLHHITNGGSINPKTGLLEFTEDEEDTGDVAGNYGGDDYGGAGVDEEASAMEQGRGSVADPGPDYDGGGDGDDELVGAGGSGIPKDKNSDYYTKDVEPAFGRMLGLHRTQEEIDKSMAGVGYDWETSNTQRRKGLASEVAVGPLTDQPSTGTTKRETALVNLPAGNPPGAAGMTPDQMALMYGGTPSAFKEALPALADIPAYGGDPAFGHTDPMKNVPANTAADAAVLGDWNKDNGFFGTQYYTDPAGQIATSSLGQRLGGTVLSAIPGIDVDLRTAAYGGLDKSTVSARPLEAIAGVLAPVGGSLVAGFLDEKLGTEISLYGTPTSKPSGSVPTADPLLDTPTMLASNTQRKGLTGGAGGDVFEGDGDMAITYDEETGTVIIDEPASPETPFHGLTEADMAYIDAQPDRLSPSERFNPDYYNIDYTYDPETGTVVAA